MFPVGALDKAAVREHARELGLPVADKPDSHEICFVPDGDHAAFLERHGGQCRAARSATSTARCVGRHDGVHRFTVGQRKGLGLSSADPALRRRHRRRGADGHRRPARGARAAHADASGVNWIAGSASAAGTRVTARIRHRHREAAASRHAADPTATVARHLRRAAERHHAGTGGRVLRRRRRCWAAAGLTMAEERGT